jgi:hypothetical protein
MCSGVLFQGAPRRPCGCGFSRPRQRSQRS